MFSPQTKCYQDETDICMPPMPGIDMCDVFVISDGLRVKRRIFLLFCKRQVDLPYQEFGVFYTDDSVISIYHL